MKQSFLFSWAKALGLCCLLTIMVTACTKSGSGHGKPKSIYETIVSNPNYSFLAAAVTKAGLADALKQQGKTGLTLFAPTNDAFRAAGFNGLNDLLKVPDDVLKSILLYHVLGSEIRAEDIPQANNTPVTSLNQQSVFVTKTPAGKVFVNGVSVIRANIEATNGVIHEINRVLTPAVGNIIATAQSNANLSLLVTAVLRASQGSTNVATVLSGTGPFTVFAPTNEAIIAAGFPDEQAINSADPNTLASILTYHVIAGRIFSSDLSEGIQTATLNGGTLTISLAGGPKVKGKSNTKSSAVIATDVVASNGVVHVIDQVLLP